METGAALATTVAVMMVRVAMDRAMAVRRDVDQVVPMALVAADQDAGRKGEAVPKGAALVIVVRKVVVLMTDGADRMVLVTAVQDVDRMVVLAVAVVDPMVLPRADLMDLAAAVPGAAQVLALADPVVQGDLEGLSIGWIRSTTSSTKSSGKLSP